MKLNKGTKCVDGKKISASVIAFGIGALVSSFCPTGLLFFIAALIIVSLGFMLRF